MRAVKPKVRSELTVVELDGEAVIYMEESGDLHHLNPTATIVFGLCDGTTTMREIAKDISDAFGVPVDEVEVQVRDLIRRFRKARLLESSPASRDRGEARRCLTHVPHRTEPTPQGR